MSKAAQIQEASSNGEANVGYLATLSDKELAERLDTIYLQSELALRQNNLPALELLEVWRSQVIAARIHKAEHQVPDAESEIALVAAEVETFVSKADARAEILQTREAAAETGNTSPAESTVAEESRQLSLFDE